MLAGGGNSRIVTILIAIGTGKDDDAKFHDFILTTKGVKEHEDKLQPSSLLQSILYKRIKIK